MIIVFFVWVVLFVLFVATGNVINGKLLNRHSGIFYNFILGFITLSAISSLWSFWFPSNKYLLFLIVSVVYKSIFNESFRIFNRFKSIYFFDYVFLTIVGFYFITSVINVSSVFDTFLYHNPIISFLGKHKLIPGLSNLHGRFGFNNLTYSLCAIVTLEDRLPYYLLNGLLVFVVIIYLYFSIKKNKKIVDKIVYLNVMFWLFWYVSGWLSSPDSLLVSFIVFFTVKFMQNNFQMESSDLILVVFLPMIKLSAILFSFFFSIVCFIQTAKQKTDLKISLLFSGILIIVCIARSFILTGQIAYPIQKPYLSVVDFSISKTKIVDEIVGVQGWARFPGNEYSVNHAKYPNVEQWLPLVMNNKFNEKYTRLPFIGSISKKIVLFFLVGFFLFSIIFFIKKNNFNYSIYPILYFISFLFVFLQAPNWSWFEPYLTLGLLMLLFVIGNWLAKIVLILFSFLVVPYQGKRLLEIGVESVSSSYKKDIVLFPENIGDRFDRKPIRSVIDTMEGVTDLHTIYTRLDTIRGLKPDVFFTYRYSYLSNGLCPKTDEICVPCKLRNNIRFTGSSFKDIDVFNK